MSNVTMSDAATQLGETLKRTAEFLADVGADDAAWMRIQRSALAYADREGGMEDGKRGKVLTAHGMVAMCGYLDRTVEMWDVVPN